MCAAAIEWTNSGGSSGGVWLWSRSDERREAMRRIRDFLFLLRGKVCQITVTYYFLKLRRG